MTWFTHCLRTNTHRWRGLTHSFRGKIQLMTDDAEHSSERSSLSAAVLSWFLRSLAELLSVHASSYPQRGCRYRDHFIVLFLFVCRVTILICCHFIVHAMCTCFRGNGRPSACVQSITFAHNWAPFNLQKMNGHTL